MVKKIIFALIVLVIVVVIIQGFFGNEEAEFDLVEVVKGSVVEEVSETGQVQMGDSIKLGFKNSGTVAAILVKVGDRVWPGTALAKIDTVQLSIERAEAQANLDIAQAKLDQLLTGATAEEIQAARTDVANAQVALADVQEDYQEDLSQAQEDAANTLDNAYLKAASAYNEVVSLRKTYFNASDQESIAVQDKESNTGILVSQILTSINEDDVEAALPAVKNYLSDIYDDLGVVRDMTEVTNYTDIVSASDKDDLDTERVNINTVLTNVSNAQQAIASARITGETAVNTAQGSLQEAQDDLALILAEPSQADIALYQAQVSQAQAKVDLLDNKIWDATLRSPVQGQITRINKEIGEIWQPSLTDSVIVMLPASPYEVEVDIYEEDIVKMDIGDDVDITLIAFPKQVFRGKVTNINPAEELIENVVYYTVTINFTETPEGIRPGMTADLVIKTDSRQDVLVVPEDAIEEKEDKYFVKVYQDEEIIEREITVGLQGTADDMVEILSGLYEGEQVIVE